MTNQKYSDFPLAPALQGNETVPLQTPGGVTSRRSALDYMFPIVGDISCKPSGDTSGVTDTANMLAYWAAAAANTRTSAGLSALVGTTLGQLHSGDYWVNSSILDGSTPNPKSESCMFVGRGMGATAIHYTPTVPGTPFIRNKRWLNLMFRDITFVGNDPTADFFQSLEQGGASNIQENIFTRCAWVGSWQNIMLKTGGNNNSEERWDDCDVGGTANWLFIPGKQVCIITSGQANMALAANPSGGFCVGSTLTFGTTVGTAGGQIVAGTTYFIVAISGLNMQVSATSGGTAITFNANGTSTATTASDQFLNHWWDKCKYTSVTNGSWINASFGGSFNLNACDISNNKPTAPNYIFNLLGSSHAGGVCNFSSNHLRIEHVTDNSLLLHTTWDKGKISFRNLDQSSQVGNRPITQQYVLVERVNTIGASLRFEDCDLLGQHVYSTSATDYQHQSQGVYDNCTLWDNPTVDDFIVNTPITNSSGLYNLHFDNCRNELNGAVAGYREVVDSDPNWNSTGAGNTKRRGFQMFSNNSDWPQAAGSFHIRIPRGAMIVSVLFAKFSGSGNSGAFQYTLQTNEVVPTVIAGGAATPMAGANAGATVAPVQVMATALGAGFVCVTDLQRELVLIDSSGSRAGIFTNLMCLVEYIG